MANRAGEAGYGDDDRLPWLETVEDDYREGPSLGRILLLILLALLVVGAAGFGFYWYQKQQGLTGNGELINAQEGDYKVRPDEVGGFNAQGAGDAVYDTSAGVIANATVRPDDAEAPIEGAPAPSPTPSATAGQRTATVVIPATGGSLDAGAGALVQLGAYPDEQGANGAWERMKRRVPMLAPLGKAVERVDRDGKATFRLRVNAGSADQAREVCAALKAVGESCYIAN